MKKEEKARPAYATPNFDDWLQTQRERAAHYSTMGVAELTLLLLQADYHIARYKQTIENASSLLADMPALVGESERQARRAGGLAATLTNWPAISRVAQSDSALARGRLTSAKKRTARADQNMSNLIACIDSLFTTGDRPGFAWTADFAAGYIFERGKNFTYKKGTIRKVFAERKAIHRKSAKLKK